jgi:murein DD-endopeptidase MepM/ murein hydrolase activator NlpD
MAPALGRPGLVLIPGPHGLTLALCVLIGALLIPAHPAGAQTERQKATALKEHIQEASAEEARLLEQVEHASARKEELDAQVAAIDREIAPVQNQLQAAQSRLSALEARQRVLETRLRQTREQLATAKDDLARQAIAAYTGGTEGARLAQMIVRSRDLGEVAAKRTYIRVAAGSQTETIARTERLRDEVQDLRDEVDSARGKAQEERDVVAAQRAQLQHKRDAQQSVRTQVVAEVASLNQARDEILARKDEFQAQVRALEQQSNAIAETLRQRPAAPGGDGPAAGRRAGGLVSPLPGESIVSRFGPRVHPIYGDVRMHTGADMGGHTGQAIRAAADGVVVSAGSQGGYGQATVIDHGNGMATLYAHQSQILVSEGQRVSQGALIGKVGCTGTCTGPHLHFEVRINGAPVDPARYL